MQQQNGTIFLRLLLNRYYTGKPEQLAKIMPKEQYDALATTLLPQKDPACMLFVPKKWLSSVNSSWLVPTIESFSAEMRKVFLRAFPSLYGQDGVSCYNDTVQDFLITYLHSVWTEKEVPPKELLPAWELSALLELSRPEILEIVDLLAQHDLVEEMRHIVDKRLLQSILQHLSVQQQHYLRVLLRQKSRREPSTISVRELIKEGKKFPQMLHKFGLQRLALAMSGASEDFVWHIVHTLDAPRAKFLQSLIKEEEVPNQTHQAVLQVQHIIQFLKTEAAP